VDKLSCGLVKKGFGASLWVKHELPYPYTPKPSMSIAYRASFEFQMLARRCSESAYIHQVDPTSRLKL